MHENANNTPSDERLPAQESESPLLAMMRRRRAELLERKIRLVMTPEERAELAELEKTIAELGGE